MIDKRKTKSKSKARGHQSKIQSKAKALQAKGKRCLNPHVPLLRQLHRYRGPSLQE
jgi:hypothetical protein